VWYGVLFLGRGGLTEKPENCITCRTTFEYEGTAWRALALYPCQSGLVVDLCCEVPREEAERFAARWGDWFGKESTLSELQRLEYDNENPFRQDLHIELLLDGRQAPSVRRSVAWHIPVDGFPPPKDSLAADAVAAYGLASDTCRGFFRLHKEWPAETGRTLNKPSLRLRRRWRMVPCRERFFCLPGDAPMDVPFHHPVTGAAYTLHVRDCRAAPAAMPFIKLDNEEAEDEFAGTLRQIPVPAEIIFPGEVLKLLCSVEPPLPEGENAYIRSNNLRSYTGYSVKLGDEPATWTVFANPQNVKDPGRDGEWFISVNTRSGPRQTVPLEI
jgi:hypothetical protein